MVPNFGNHLKLLREQRKLSQRDLEKKAGLSNSCISRYESNVIKPSAESLIRLADAMNLSMETLLGVDSAYNTENSSDSGNTFKNIKKKFFENLSISTGGVSYTLIEKAYYTSTAKSVFDADKFYNLISKDISPDWKGFKSIEDKSFNTMVERLQMFYESNASFLKSIKDSNRYLRSSKIRKSMELANDLIAKNEGIFKYNQIDKTLIKYTELRFMANFDTYQDCVIKAEYECINYKDSRLDFGTDTRVNPLPCYVFLDEILEMTEDTKKQNIMKGRFNQTKSEVKEAFAKNTNSLEFLRSTKTI